MANTVKRCCVNFFKSHGYTLNSEAVTALIEYAPEDDPEKWFENVLELLQQQPLESPMITLSVIQETILNCQQYKKTNIDSILNVIDAFTIPKFTYVNERKKLEPYAGPELNLLGNATTKAELFRSRYAILQQRTARHELFLPLVPGAVPDKDAKKFELKTVEYLLASTARLGDILVLGMLTQLKEGKFYIEDITGAVPLNLSNANFHIGLITENCFVLAEGTYDDGIFHVNALGFPPAESANSTRSYFGNKNFFGGPSSTCVKASTHLKTLEQESPDAMFVIISDVWLNELKVLEKLKSLFDGFAQNPALCYIMIGNFLSSYTGNLDASQLKAGLKALADIICTYPSIHKHSKFVLVPGPKDPGLGKILPRRPISACLAADFKKRVPSAVFATNPCRIQYCTQEIVVLREDIVTKMCRNAIYFPREGEIPNHFAKTLVSQSHLCPLPLHVMPVFWPYDHVLQLYPLPDVVICADRYDSFCVNNTDCVIMNPGSFPRNNFNFQVYIPASKQVEASQIPDD